MLSRRWDSTMQRRTKHGKSCYNMFHWVITNRLVGNRFQISLPCPCQSTTSRRSTTRSTYVDRANPPMAHPQDQPPTAHQSPQHLLPSKFTHSTHPHRINHPARSLLPFMLSPDRSIFFLSYPCSLFVRAVWHHHFSPPFPNFFHGYSFPSMTDLFGLNLCLHLGSPYWRQKGCFLFIIFLMCCFFSFFFSVTLFCTLDLQINP